MRNYARQQELKSAANNASNANKGKSMELLDTHAEIVEQKDQIEELMTVESALLTTFDGQCRGVLGQNYSKLGAKVKMLVKNVAEIKRLIWTLLNADCVQFHSQLIDLRTFDTVKDNERELFSFSIFKMCDNDTNRLIVALAKLAKDRIFKVI